MHIQAPDKKVMMGHFMSEPNIPKVSVCIPTFNGADYLCQAVESILAQNYQDFEIIIVDNCSTDQTATLVEGLQKKNDQRIRFYKNESNIGMAENFNKCLEYAQGTYIKFLCADDLLLPECLEQMAAALDAHHSVTLVCGGRMIIDETGKELKLKQYSSRDTIIPGGKAITRCLFGKNYIGEPTAIMFRKNDLTGCFRSDLLQLVDMEVWLQLLEQGDLLNIKGSLCAIRLHSKQVSRANCKSGQPIEDRMQLLSRFALKAHGVSNLIRLKSLFHMSYRVYLYRNYLSEERKQEILSLWGNRFLYSLMFIWGPIEEYLIKSPKYNN